MKERILNEVQKFRTKTGETQEGLAESVGVSRQTIIAIEKGNYTPSVLLALKLATHYKISVEKLFTLQYDK